MHRRLHPGWKRVDSQLTEIAKTGVPFSDVWKFDGEHNRLKGMECEFHDANLQSPLDVVREKIGRDECRLMVLGTGEGNDIIWFRDELKKTHSQQAVDERLILHTFNLTKITNPELTPIVVDHSRPSGFVTPFEVWQAPELIGRFDVVISQRGIAWHTESPTAAVIKASTLLDKDGIMFLETKTPELKWEALHKADRFWRLNMSGQKFEAVNTDNKKTENWIVVKRTE